MFRALIAAMLLTFPAHADGETPGDFDYYVLSLSWTPTWCNITGDHRNSPQCDKKTGYGFTLHGLWPQYETGWPAYCRSVQTAPSRSQTAAMTDIMGSSGLAWHQWKKHGVCAGGSAAEYYQLSRDAYARVNRPTIFRKLKDRITLPASVVEQAFLESNPDLSADQITITCKNDQIQEARICLTRDLEFRTCGADVIRDCTLKRAGMDKMR